MKRELFKRRKYEFVSVINNIKRLPNIGEYYFTDGEDMRLWYDAITKLTVYNDYIKEINILVKKYDIKCLTDEEKKQEFLRFVLKNKHIPNEKEKMFTDGNDMFSWYNKYREIDFNFEKEIKESLPEYQELDLTFIWPDVKEEFINIIKRLRRIPKYGEKYLENGIDVRLLYDKLQIHDPMFIEKILLHLETYKIRKLSIEQRLNELMKKVRTLGYVPYLQESRFSDGTDMFTWAQRYRYIVPGLDKELSKYQVNQPNNVKIYSVPKFKNKEGKYYSLETKYENLDLSNIIAQELAEGEELKIDSNDDMKGKHR